VVINRVKHHAERRESDGRGGGDGDASEERVTEPLPARWRRVHYRTPTTERNKTFPSLGRSTRDRSLDLRPLARRAQPSPVAVELYPAGVLATCSERQRGEADGTARRDRPRRRGVGAQRADPIRGGRPPTAAGFFVDAYRRSTTHLLVENDEIVAFASRAPRRLHPLSGCPPRSPGARSRRAPHRRRGPGTPISHLPRPHDQHRGARLLRTPRLRGSSAGSTTTTRTVATPTTSSSAASRSASGSPGSSGGSREVLRIARGPRSACKTDSH